MQQRTLIISDQELNRINIIKQIVDKQLKQKDGAKQLNISIRQIRRLSKKYQLYGAKGLLSRQIGRRGNRSLGESMKTNIKRIIEKNYADFGPTFASEKLKEVHKLSVSKETLRLWMIEWNLWKAKRQKKVKIHQSRERRSCFGELIQIDGSHHNWFEGRSKKCCLLVFIDDATSRLVGLRFENEETTQGYFKLAREYMECYGRPLAFYSDKDSVFRSSTSDKVGAETQWGRAMRELNVEIICAHSPQAKGRVERANKTLQDRLIKEMRLRKINTVEEANIFLPEFMKWWNAKFSVTPASEKDVHRKGGF